MGPRCNGVERERIEIAAMPITINKTAATAAAQ